MVDFNKMLEDLKNGKSLATTEQQISIQTVDGQVIGVGGDSGASLVDYLTSGGGVSLPRITAGQPRDDRLREAANQLFVISREQAVSERGQEEWVNNYEILGPSIQVRPIGYSLQRSYMEKYDPNDSSDELRRPLCKSTDFVYPDAEFIGKYSTCCAQLGRGGKLVTVCPMAKWGEKDAKGKQLPPACSETYVLAVMFLSEQSQEWTLAEVYMRRGNANIGKTLLQKMRMLEMKGYPLYSLPLRLEVVEAGIGNIIGGSLVTPNDEDELRELLPDQDNVAAFEEGIIRWKEAGQVRAERANASGFGPYLAQGSAQQVQPGQQAAQIPASVPTGPQIVSTPVDLDQEIAQEPAQPAAAPAPQSHRKANKAKPLI